MPVISQVINIIYYSMPLTSQVIDLIYYFPNQAFVYNKSAIATQFHPEITREMIDRWTMHGAHRLNRPGAQPRQAHIKGWELFNERIDLWVKSLLDRFQLFGNPM